MTELATDALPHRSDSSDADRRTARVVPYYLSDRKARIAVARVDGRLYAFDDLCTCADQPCPLSGGLLTGHDDHVPVPRLPVRHHDRAVVNGPATEPLAVYEVQEVDEQIQIRADPPD